MSTHNARGRILNGSVPAPGLALMTPWSYVGCGGGFFALPAARIAGSSGKVIGIDQTGGTLCNPDWEKRETPFGPHLSI